MSLEQHSTETLLEAIRDRLEAIERGEVERRGLLPPPAERDLDVYRALSQLLRAVRTLRYADLHDSQSEREALFAASGLLKWCNLVDEVDHIESEELNDVILYREDDDDIIKLGCAHAGLSRTLGDLQSLYKIRLDVCRDTIVKLHAEHKAEIAKYNEDCTHARKEMDELETTNEHQRDRIRDLKGRIEDLELAEDLRRDERD